MVSIFFGCFLPVLKTRFISYVDTIQIHLFALRKFTVFFLLLPLSINSFYEVESGIDQNFYSFEAVLNDSFWLH